MIVVEIRIERAKLRELGNQAPPAKETLLSYEHIGHAPVCCRIIREFGDWDGAFAPSSVSHRDRGFAKPIDGVEEPNMVCRK